MTISDKTEGFIARTTLVSRSSNGELFHLAVVHVMQMLLFNVY